jgi:hypothetical protein
MMWANFDLLINKEHIIRTIVISTRDADGKYRERNWKESP